MIRTSCASERLTGGGRRYDSVGAWRESECCNKQTNKQRDPLSPSRIAWKTRTRSVVCTARKTKIPRHIEFNPSTFRQTFSPCKIRFRFDATTAGEAFDGGRRRKAGNHQHQSSTRASSARFQPRTFGTAVGAGVLRRHARSREL